MRSFAVAAIALVACAHAAPPPTPEPVQSTAQPTPPAAAPEPAKPVEPTPPAEPPARETSVYFEFDSSALSSDARAALQSLFDAVKGSSAVRVRIEGNCDERGTDEYNVALGQRRADAAKKYLIDLGLAASRITAVSNGEEKPRASGHDEAAWRENRRDDVIPQPAVSGR